MFYKDHSVSSSQIESQAAHMGRQQQNINRRVVVESETWITFSCRWRPYMNECFSGYYLWNFPWYCPWVNATGPQWWWVNDFQVMAWCSKVPANHTLNQCWPILWCHMVSPSHNELMSCDTEIQNSSVQQLIYNQSTNYWYHNRDKKEQLLFP